MKFGAFTHIPWRFLTKRTQRWPFDNSAFSASRGQIEIKRALSLLSLADKLGFHWVGVGEEHCNPFGLLPNAALGGGILAYATRKAKIALLGAPLPLLNPLRVAEEFAWVDVVSGGRLVAGLVRGVPQNYAAYNIDPNESWGRFEEGLALVIKAWTHRAPFSWHSQYYAYKDIAIWPTVHQRPHPPILMSCGSKRAASIAASNRSIVAQIHLSRADAIERAVQNFAHYKQACSHLAWTPNSEHFVIGIYAVVSDNDEDAQRIMEPALAYLYSILSGAFEEQKKIIFQETSYLGANTEGATALTSSEALSLGQRIDAGIIICGSPETVKKQIIELKRRTGAGLINLHFSVGNMSYRDVRRSIVLFAKEVMPSLIE